MDLLAASAVLVGSMSWTTGTILSRRLPLPQSSILLSGMNLLGGGVLLCAVSLLWGETLPSDVVSMRSIAGVLYLIVAGSIIGFVAYMWLLKVETASKVGTYAFVNPAIAVFLGWLGGGEALSGRILGATALMVTGVAILVTGKEESNPARAPVPRAAAVRESG
jgi:drug/metabolite transporter (DMT)-like permease